jgi:hypothetical protein
MRIPRRLSSPDIRSGNSSTAQAAEMAASRYSSMKQSSVTARLRSSALPVASPNWRLASSTPRVMAATDSATLMLEVEPQPMSTLWSCTGVSGA